MKRSLTRHNGRATQRLSTWCLLQYRCFSHCVSKLSCQRPAKSPSTKGRKTKNMRTCGERERKVVHVGPHHEAHHDLRECFKEAASVAMPFVRCNCVGLDTDGVGQEPASLELGVAHLEVRAGVAEVRRAEEPTIESSASSFGEGIVVVTKCFKSCQGTRAPREGQEAIQ